MTIRVAREAAILILGVRVDRGRGQGNERQRNNPYGLVPILLTTIPLTAPAASLRSSQEDLDREFPVSQPV